MSELLTYQQWAETVERPRVIGIEAMKDEIGRRSQFNDWISLPGLRFTHEDKRHRWIALPAPVQEAIRHLYMWGDETVRDCLDKDELPPADGADEEDEETLKERTRRQLLETPGGKVIDGFQRLGDLKIGLLRSDETAGIVRQPIFFVNSSLGRRVQTDLRRLKAQYEPIERGLYCMVGRCPMFGLRQGEAAELLGYEWEDGPEITRDGIDQAIQIASTTDDHEEIFEWMASRNLVPKGDPQKRSHVWYVPLLPESINGGGYVDQWTWPDRR